MRRIWRTPSIYLDVKYRRVPQEIWLDDFTRDQPITAYLKSPEVWGTEAWDGCISDASVHEKQLFGPNFASRADADKWVRRNWG